MGTIPLGRLLPAARQRANVALLAWCYEAADAAGEVRVHKGWVSAVLGVNPHLVSMGWRRGTVEVRGRPSLTPTWRSVVD